MMENIYFGLRSEITIKTVINTSELVLLTNIRSVLLIKPKILLQLT